jgi:hypothetical protein
MEKLKPDPNKASKFGAIFSKVKDGISNKLEEAHMKTTFDGDKMNDMHDFHEKIEDG